MSMLEKQREHFNRVAGDYRLARTHPNHLKLKELIWDYALSDLALSKEARSREAGGGGLDVEVSVLEAMCGFAEGAALLSRRFSHIRYCGFDYSDSVVETLKATRPDLNVYQQDVSRFESNELYDIVLLIGGLHHVAQCSREVVARLARNIRPGGYFINFEPTHGNRVFQYIREKIYRRNPLFDHETERAFGVDELMRMFLDAGLQREKVFYPGLLAYVLYYNPDAFPLLNFGSTKLVSLLWSLEKPFLQTSIARLLSFATFSIWRKP